jgi:hypothetical protein
MLSTRQGNQYWTGSAMCSSYHSVSSQGVNAIMWFESYNQVRIYGVACPETHPCHTCSTIRSSSIRVKFRNLTFRKIREVSMTSY